MFKRLMVLCLCLMVTGAVSAQPDPNADCTGAGYSTPRLTAGMAAQMVAGETVNIHADADVSSPVVSQLEPSSQITLNIGPHCHEGLVWWQFQFQLSQGDGNSPYGWIPETLDGGDVLEPVVQSLTLPGSQPITSDNVSELTQVAQLDYGGVRLFTWSPDSAMIAISTTGAIWLHERSGLSGMPLKPNGFDRNLTDTMRFSADGSQFAAVGASTNDSNAVPMLHVWSTQSGDLVSSQTFNQSDYAYVAALSPDFSTLATAQWDGTITLWDTASAQPRAVLTRHQAVGVLHFTPDGQTLISVGGYGMDTPDSTLRLWDVANGTQRALIELDSTITAVAISPDNQQLALLVPVLNAATGYMEGELWFISVDDASTFRKIPLDVTLGAVDFNADGSLLEVRQAPWGLD